MRPRELLGAAFACECGRRHEIPTKHIIYAEDAPDRLNDVLGSLTDGRRLVLVADERTWSIAGDHAGRMLEQAGWSVNDVIVRDEQGHSPVCDDTAHEWLKERLSGYDIALAVGAGVINDLTKWSAFEYDMPYAVLATAATMNGFTAANVAPMIKGIKTLIRARPPLAVFAIPSVIVAAPFELTASGLGDALAKPVSAVDWLLNHTFCDEYFCKFSSDMINDLEPFYLDRPEQIKNRDPIATEALFDALLGSGIAMTIAGTSAPASGGEHMLSHTLDMMSGVDNVPHDLHGRQVGLGTIFASALYDRIFRIESPMCHELPSEIDGPFWGDRAASVREQYELKKPSLRAIRKKLQDDKTWRSFRDAAAQQIRPPGQIKKCLIAAGAAHTFSDIGCSRERLLAALRHMHEIRKRPTVIDLAWMLGILPEAIGEIADMWLTS